MGMRARHVACVVNMMTNDHDDDDAMQKREGEAGAEKSRWGCKHGMWHVA